MLAKNRRQNIPLQRRDTGFANAGFEPYSEYYAADIANQLGIGHVNYELHKWKQTLCSSCELFTSKEQSFVPVAHLVKTGGFVAVETCYRNMGEEYWQAFSDMLAFDALICNTDRHLNNFGFLANSDTNEIVSAAPLFDHGNAFVTKHMGTTGLQLMPWKPTPMHRMLACTAISSKPPTHA